MSCSPRRGAYTLLEVTVVASILSLLLLVTGMTLHGLYSGNRRLRAEAHLHATMDSLALRLRRDVHAARDVRLLGEGENGLSVEHTDGSRITYRAVSEGIIREVQTEVEREAAVVHRDRFRLPASSGKVAWKLEEEPPRVILEVSNADLDGNAPSRGAFAFRLETVVGLIAEVPSPSREPPP